MDSRQMSGEKQASEEEICQFQTLRRLAADLLVASGTGDHKKTFEVGDEILILLESMRLNQSIPKP